MHVVTQYLFSFIIPSRVWNSTHKKYYLKKCSKICMHLSSWSYLNRQYSNANVPTATNACNCSASCGFCVSFVLATCNIVFSTNSTIANLKKNARYLYSIIASMVNTNKGCESTHSSMKPIRMFGCICFWCGGGSVAMSCRFYNGHQLLFLLFSKRLKCI